MNSTEALVIVGSGHAGAEVAIAAREVGWLGEIAMVGSENGFPYQRPPLSKGYLLGSVSSQELLIRSVKAYDSARVRLYPGLSVNAIDRATRSVALSDGSRMPYARLALATGGRPRPLAAANGRASSAKNLHYVRTQSDVDRLRSQLIPGRRLVIVGGGYIGLEVAASAVKLGLSVTVLEAESRVLARVTAPLISSFYEELHRSRGVDIRTNVNVTGFELDKASRIVAVTISGGESLPSDVVVVGIGLLPNTELAAAAGLSVDNGILVNSSAVTSDPLIVAAGDCTRFHSALYDCSLRLESLPNALEQARVAAATLCGRTKRHDPTPWFWSDQYELKLKMVGVSQGYDRLVIRGRPELNAFSAFYLLGRRILPVDTVNRIPDFMQAKRLVAERIEVEPEALADEAVSLATLTAVTH